MHAKQHIYGQPWRGDMQDARKEAHSPHNTENTKLCLSNYNIAYVFSKTRPKVAKNIGRKDAT